MANKLYDETSIQSIANAIRGKNGSSDSYTVGQMAQAISDIPAGGGGEPEEKDVNFYDYDGTRLYSYTSVEAAALTAFPALPDHTDIGLTAEGWNYTLDDLVNLADPSVDIGCTYKTTDGTTKIFYDIYRPCTQSINVWELVNRNGSASTIDWGDGSTPVAISTTATIYSHEYTTPGNYTVTITPSTLETVIYFGNGSVSAFGDAATNDNDPLKGMIIGIFTGSRVVQNSRSLFNLFKLKFITFPTPYNLNEYSSSQTYEVGDIVWYKNLWGDRYGGKFWYRCKTAISTPEEWNSNRWARLVEPYVGGMNDTTGTYNLKAIITPAEYNYGPDQFMSWNYCKTISLGARGYHFGTNLGSLVKQNACKKFTFYLKDPLSNNPQLNNDGFEGKTLERLDIIGNSNASIYFGVWSFEYYNRRGSIIRDIYIQKKISLPLFEGSHNDPKVRIHVPYHLYNDMMDTSWGTTYGNRLIQMAEMPYEENLNLEFLIHPAEWIDNTKINYRDVVEDSGWKSSDYIEVTGGERLYGTWGSYSNQGAYYDANKEYLGAFTLNYRKWSIKHEGYILDVPSTAYYIRICHTNAYAPYTQIWRELPES